MSTSMWLWPVPGHTRISSGYGYRGDIGVEGATADHDGIDIPAPYGTPIVAASSGKVIRSGAMNGYGQWVVIQHDNGLYTTYGHMDKRYVSEGDYVEAGTMIATVASEGASSGNHLHFQVDRGGYGSRGTPQNPLNYVSSSGPSAVSSDYIPDTYSDVVGEEYDASYYQIVEAGGTTIGQRVSGVTSQPVFAYVNIYIGEDQLLLSSEPPRPNIFQSFEFTRLEGAGETVTFTLFDDNWEEIEAALSANYDNIGIEYGYYGTGKKSQRYKLLLQNYSLSFESTGTIISVEGTTEGAMTNLTQRSIVLNTFNPTDAVKKICEALNYKVYPENFDSSHDINADNPFNVVEQFPITYIYNTIIPQASQENEELFTFEVDPDGVAYFKRDRFDTTKTDTLRTYIYQKGYDSSVIDFTVDIKATFGGTGTFGIATEYRSTVFDTMTKDTSSYTASTASVVTEASGDLTHTRSNQSNPIVDSAGYTPSQMKNRVYYYMKSVNSAYEATLTVVGDPTIKIHEYIRVVNMTDKGYLHHTSGVYWVEGVIDTIQDGSMVTSLKLLKNATAGDIDGLEIINPKLLIK